ncbi:MAG: TlpA family protein disulfide reductase [Desulfobaccales bacterium]
MSRVLTSLPQSLLLAALLSLALLSSGAWAGEIADANAGHTGQALSVKSLLVKGKTTVIDFYSPYCPPCMRLAPIMARLAEKRPDLALVKVNINRLEFVGIDWSSPLAQQYQIRQVPYFMIFSPQGQLLSQGKDAVGTVQRWLQEAGLMK